MNRLLSCASALIIIWIMGYFLIIGSSILIPLVVALFIWHLLNTIQGMIKRIPMFGEALPGWVSMVMAFAVAAIFISIFVNIITTNVNLVLDASGRYQENLMQLVDNIDAKYRVQILVKINQFIKLINVQTMLLKISAVFTTLTSSMVLIILYVAFLFVEQHFFHRKMDALITTAGHQKIVHNILKHVDNDMQAYLGLKSLLSLMTALPSWVVMKLVGVDFAAFWALLIFFLNFIPNIGAIIAILFPAALVIVQYTDWVPFLEIVIGLGLIQFIVGNLIEPRFLSHTLNLSPLVILLSLSLWGAIWGVLGMFLSVPITVMLMIIFAHFEKTRPIAIFLSQDGDIYKVYETIPVENTLEKNWLQF
ncbi:MAG: AI-2E family transporter [Legionella sp.]|nr:AI-2E family transporter [Legionella sp.]